LKPQPGPEWAQDFAKDFMAMYPPLLTRSEGAKALRKSQRAFDADIANGAIKCLRSGGRVLIPAREIVAHLMRSA
jgi:hypothetical protein